MQSLLLERKCALHSRNSTLTDLRKMKDLAFQTEAPKDLRATVRNRAAVHKQNIRSIFASNADACCVILNFPADGLPGSASRASMLRRADD